MRKLFKILFLFLVLFISSQVNLKFFQDLSRERDVLVKEYNSLRIKNMKLHSQRKRLASDARIREYAEEKLDMHIASAEDDELYLVKAKKEKKSNAYVIFDYMAPSLEAIINN